MSTEENQNPTTKGDEEDVEAENANISFEPILKLSTVETQTGEEQDDVLFKMRAKLYRWDKDVSGTPCWRERGTGDVKFLKNRNTSKVRMLMRREKTHKVCANFYIQQHVTIKVNPTSDKSWIWTVKDYSEEPKEELFAIRFGSVENANKFKTEFENIQAGKLGAPIADDDEKKEEDEKKDDSKSSSSTTTTTSTTSDSTPESKE
eukprot:TRINITY_DN980_c0_g1_i1.p1 TRINITY_DN980_c0_g1~~TRINITY_DN980_c0_g1_i1.p1  ORF type:complete len:205 (-),score=66.87 TRINITY_DN980_c0_g1_i1:75-689(-)